MSTDTYAEAAADDSEPTDGALGVPDSLVGAPGANAKDAHVGVSMDGQSDRGVNGQSDRAFFRAAQRSMGMSALSDTERAM